MTLHLCDLPSDKFSKNTTFQNPYKNLIKSKLETNLVMLLLSFYIPFSSDITVVVGGCSYDGCQIRNLRAKWSGFHLVQLGLLYDLYWVPKTLRLVPLISNCNPERYKVNIFLKFFT